LRVSSPRENGDIDAHCPLHNDGRRSAVINFEEGVWYCNTEATGGTLSDLMKPRDSWVDPPAHVTGTAARAARVRLRTCLARR
jgi:hypothetical protein